MLIDRRRLLQAGSAGLALAGPFQAVMAAQKRASDVGLTTAAGAQLRPADSPYGPLAPVADEATGLPLLMLPRGFRYRSFSWTGDRMDDGLPVAGRHDGMAVVKTEGADLLIVRNHEVRNGPALGAGRIVYGGSGAGGAGGGCTMVRLRNGRPVEQRAVLGGTLVNCAGGPSLWNSWLSCEETTEDRTAKGGQRHGYVFDVSPHAGETSAVPLTAMGRFRHEAVAADPRTGDVFLTEDDRNAAGLYRFRPADNRRRYGALEGGGVLEAARVVGRPGADLLALAGPHPGAVARVGETVAIEWVPLDAPDSEPVRWRDPSDADPKAREVSGPFAEARAKGALRMSRGEGIWWDPRSDAAYIVDTSFGVGENGRPGHGLGGIWAYRPDRTERNRGTLTLVYAAAARVAGNNPDNITVSPRGGLLTVDDGDAVDDGYGPGNRIMAYRADGLATIFAKNSMQLTEADIARMGRSGQFAAKDYRGSELCGACFSPDGKMLLVNVQSPGVTLAITGPWRNGML